MDPITEPANFFAPEEPSRASSVAGMGWKVMRVDDDPDVHDAFLLTARGITIDGAELRLLRADSAAQAKLALANDPDIALLLLDVVMENDRAGLEVVHYVRRVLNNHSVRIILVTGQPGYMSQRQVVTEYEIDGFMHKVELTADKMYFSIYSAIRSYKNLRQLERLNSSLTETQYAIDRAGIAIMWSDAETGHFIYANQQACEQLGYTPEEILSCSVFAISIDLSLESYSRMLGKVARRGNYRQELEYRRKDGSIYPAEVASYYRADAEQNRIVSFVTDITERKATELAMIAAKEAAEASNMAKDQFLAVVSHELRTPLNAVIGFSELSLNLSQDPKQRDYMSKIAMAGKSLSGIINNLLDLTKIAAGHMELDITTFSLRALVARCGSVMSFRLSEKGLTLTQQIDTAVPDVLRGDSLRLEQILLNLLSNAVKFTDTGGIDIRVAGRETAAGQVNLTLEVEDSGIGMRAEDLGKLFQPFVQADASMSRKYGGTGLGLAICKRIAELMGGSARVTSELRHGTTFHIELWLGLGNSADLPPADTPVVDRRALSMSYQNATILVVDDQPMNREIVVELLNQVGIKSREAENGLEAVEILFKSPPDCFDLVLMDIQMPELDGLSATIQVRQRVGFENLPIIAMTAHTMEHERQDCVLAGMNDHIGKPFDTGHFYRVLSRWISRAKRADARPRDVLLPSSAAPVPPTAVVTGGGLAALTKIDTQAGIGRFVGNETRYRHWLVGFLNEGPTTITKLTALLADNDLDQAQKVAHGFKGRVGMLGMVVLHPVASAFEAALKAREPTDTLFAELAQGVAQTCQDISTALDLPPAAAACETQRINPSPEKGV